MIEIVYGTRVEATCRFNYSGPAGTYTLVQEIGDLVVGPPAPEALWVFNTLDRWESEMSISPGAGQTKKMIFTVQKADGLRNGVVYDMNFEIGRGSKRDNTWELLKRVLVADVIKIAESPLFSNLSVSYKKV